MGIYVATLACSGNQFEVMVGEVGWSPEALGSGPVGTGMFDTADQLLDAVYGWQRVGNESWVAVPGSNDTVFVVAVHR